ncbi:MAG: hypothetical protein KY461_07855 [Actinobacteria bacterium]|nr:hypothetical protein [Actinomycetota bacterium]
MNIGDHDLADDHGFPAAFLALSDGDGACRFEVHARRDVPRDGVDPLSELAVLAGVSRLPRAMCCIPVRMRDLADDTIVSRSVLVTTATRLPDGRLDLTASSVLLPPEDDADLPASTQPVDPDLSPVGSLLCDVLATIDVSVRVEEVAAVLASWGHDVSVDPDLPPVDHARLDRARYRVHRTADELARRHRPMALGGDHRRPAAPANLPPGFRPACPL